ncbi:hypothetical protein DEU56DRAFT_692061, partial [Suillus clintonianus]|uniref:uncharacterized protein n=1 Tax=Suillus clintonianus TaxID=1904413 RepID=UPI001B87DD31
MSLDERRALEALKEDNNSTIDGWQDDYDDFSFGNICDGTEPLAISHAGGEFTDLAREVLGDFWKTNKAFAEQLPVITDAYLAW